MLPLNIFKTVIASTPLISIDLIVKNNKEEILLGKRSNRPAKNCWFVPGGRVLKDETLYCAFTRLLKIELAIRQSKAMFLGVYQHLYADNVTEDNFTTHYIVLAYEINFDGVLSELPNEQHNQYQWFTENELLNSDEVHQNTKWYFQKNKCADNEIVNKIN